jgi:transposase
MQPTYEKLFTQVKILTQQLQEVLTEIKTLKAKIKELEEKLNTNSSNSSKAPSQDPFRPRRPKKSTGRRRGAQKGHPGYPRTLVPIEQLQTLLDLRPEICSNCQSSDFDVDAVSTDFQTK